MFPFPAPAILRASGAGWTPASLPSASLDGWWDASDASTLMGGSTISRMNDKSGKANHFTAQGGKAPDYSATGISGKPGLTFPSGRIMRSPLTAVNSVRQMHAVVNAVTTSNYKVILASTFNQGIHWRIDPDSRLNMDAQAYRNMHTTSQVAVSIGARILMGSAGSTQQERVDGADYAISGSSGVPALDGLVTLGDYDVGQFPFIGSIGEIVITNDNLSNTTQRIEGYLAWKWGLQGNLPSNHPYKSAPPTTA
jgi:hypothetical protein